MRMHIDQSGNHCSPTYIESFGFVYLGQVGVPLALETCTQGVVRDRARGLFVVDGEKPAGNGHGNGNGNGKGKGKGKGNNGRTPSEQLDLVRVAMRRLYARMERLWRDQIDLMHFGPAHTMGDSAVIFRERNIVHLGDVFNMSGYPFIDADNGDRRLLPGMTAIVDFIIEAREGVRGLPDARHVEGSRTKAALVTTAVHEPHTSSRHAAS